MSLWIMIAPLFNFVEDDHEISINDDVRIRWMLKEEAEIFRGTFPEIDTVSHGLELNLGKSFDINDQDAKRKAKMEIDSVLSCLRLLRSGFISYPASSIIHRETLVDIDSPSVDWSRDIHTATTRSFYASTGGRPYYLPTRRERLDRLKKLLESFPLHGRLEGAMRWFNSGMAEHNDLDRLVDYVTALEILFLDDVQELGYKLSMRTALFLSTIKNRKIVFDNVKEAYGIRSEILHRGRTKPALLHVKHRDREIPVKWSGILETYVRAAIRGFIELERVGVAVDPKIPEDILLEREDPRQPYRMKTICKRVLDFQNEFRICKYCGAIATEKDVCDICTKIFYD